MAVAHHEIKIPFIQEVIFDPREDQRGVAFTDLRDHYSHNEASLAP
jgi:hypothetical protein